MMETETTMKTTKSKAWIVYLAMALLCVAVVARAQVPGFFSICNAITGFQVNGAAPVNHVLCGSGTVYGDCSAAPTATALAVTPSQCGGATPIATGIAANGNANCMSLILGSRKNCMTTSCAGGSVYVSGTTYTNALSVPVEEEVGMTSSGACTGADSQITYTVAGVAGYGNGIWNRCAGVAGITFIVPPGATFSATVAFIDGGAAPVLSSWTETAL